VLGQPRAGFQTPHDEASVALLNRAGLGEGFVARPLRSGGKNGAEFVIANPVLRDANANLCTNFMKIIKRAGLEPWPKIFQNLRSTRETELAEEYPLHVACAWIGNSKVVAIEHYLQVTLQVTDSHFEAAAKMRTICAHRPAPPRDTEVHDSRETREITNSPILYKCIFGGTGLEPVTSTV